MYVDFIVDHTHPLYFMYVHAAYSEMPAFLVKDGGLNSGNVLA